MSEILNELEEVTHLKADSRGRINLGSKYQNKRVKVMVYDSDQVKIALVEAESNGEDNE